MRYAIFFFASCICILANSIQATTSDSAILSKMIDDAELNIQLMDTSAAPSSIVGGTVNVITGSYIESECDLVIPGANPLIVQRSFNSGNNEKGNLCHGWDLNLPSEIIIPAMQEESFKATVKDRGANLVFEAKSGKKKMEMPLYHKHLRYGVTNCASGILGSRTNIKNKRLHYKSQARHCKLYEESGEILIYKATNRRDGDTRDYSVKEIQMPSGCSFSYDYEKKKCLKCVTSRGSRGNELSHVKWKYSNEFDRDEFFLNPQEFSLLSSAKA